MFCLLDAGFILKAFLKYRTGNETVKRLQTDTKTICFKHNHTLLLTMPSVHCASQNAIRGSSHTTDKMSQRYQFKSPRKQWLRFLLRHHSTFFENYQRYSTAFAVTQQLSQIQNGFCEDLHAILEI